MDLELYEIFLIIDWFKDMKQGKILKNISKIYRLNNKLKDYHRELVFTGIKFFSKEEFVITNSITQCVYKNHKRVY